MKYGASLRAHSIPAWAHHNIDYDEIKAFIKENTTPGNGTAVSIPGTGDALGQEVEDALFDILLQQHQRINLFVWSKAGEIKRRLDHLARQTAELRLKGNASQLRMTAKRLERYGRLESDVLKAGEELRSLSRFITAQQTAFRKLIKKYKKWSRSAGLELSFNKEVLGDASSFTKVDLEPLLAGWEETLGAVRTLYEERMSGVSAKTTNPGDKSSPTSPPDSQAMLPRLRDVLETNSLVGFDTFFATLPLGEGGSNAVYWVHPENAVELQVLLLQHARSLTVRNHSTVATPGNTLSHQNSHATMRNSATTDQDTGLLIIDDEDVFIRQQSSKTLGAKENTVGGRLQNATAVARWTKEEEAIIAAHSGNGGKALTETAVKHKHLTAVIDPSSSIAPERIAVKSSGTDKTTAKQVEDLRCWFASNPTFKPLATITSSRQRFVDIATNANGFLLATLDKAVVMKQSSLADFGALDTEFQNSSTNTFPYAVLRVRQEGSYSNNLLRVLDNSHLVERVRGFSLEYHAVWHCRQPENIVPPFWIPLMERDIRKLPKLMGKRDANIVNSNFCSQSTTPDLSASGTSDSGNGDTTAVEERSNNSRITIVDQLQKPPLSSFKKKRRSYPRGGHAAQSPKQKYWSEYDNPSDSDDDGAYVLFIDPNAESGFSQTWSSLRDLFKSKMSRGEQPLLRDEEAPSSSDEDALTPQCTRTHASYGTLASGTGFDGAVERSSEKSFWLPPITMTCLGASVAILVVGYLLAMTGRKKQAQEVDAGIIFAVVSSLLFAILGVVSLFGLGRSSVWAARIMALAVLAVDAVASGALLAWILT